jgi:hypothetical protein
MIGALRLLLADMHITFVFSLTDTKKQQETPPIRKRKSNDEKSSSEENKRLKTPVTSPSPSDPSLEKPYQIGTSSWIKKRINTYALEQFLVSSAFGLFECILYFCFLLF